MGVDKQLRGARRAARDLCEMSAQQRTSILVDMAAAVENARHEILKANRVDVARVGAGVLRDRLKLTGRSIDDFGLTLRTIARLPDVIGKTRSRLLSSGIVLHRQTVPLGVVAVVYESRPNVAVDAAGLCIRSGNAVFLKGGSEAARTNEVLCGVLQDACSVKNAVQLVQKREVLHVIQSADAVIPRGSEELIRFVRSNAPTRVIETGTGNCHVYVDKFADASMALRVILNAKTQKPYVCNAIEKVLVHNSIAASFLPRLAAALKESNVEIRGCRSTRNVIECHLATQEDWRAEYLRLCVGVKVVRSLQEAIDHINRYGSHHSDAIITRDARSKEVFFSRVDSAVVYANASTRFSDGSQFGLGAEMGISTQKLHVRGPFGAEALVTTKYRIEGTGHVRN